MKCWDCGQERQKDFKKLEERLGYQFKNKSLLSKALTHKSVNLHHNYEKLEFMGDSLVNLFIVRILYENFWKTFSLHELAEIKKYLISTKFLIELAGFLNLSEFIESKKRISDGFLSDKIVADCFEALWCVIFLETKDVNFCFDLFKKLFEKNIKNAVVSQKYKQDYKTLLLRFCKEKNIPVPFYRLAGLEGGLVVVECGNHAIREKGYGKNEKSAQQDCARKLLSILQNQSHHF